MKITLLLLALFLSSSVAFAVPKVKPAEEDLKKPIGTIVIEQKAKEKKPAKPQVNEPVPAKKPEKKTVKVKKELFETQLELEGVIESKKNTPIRLIPEAWSDLTVLSVVPHGSKVEKGDVILRFETDKLKRSIQDEEAAMPLAKLKLETAKEDLELLEKTGPIRLEGKRRSRVQKEDDFAYFEEVRRPMNERDARERLKSYQNYLTYAEEELRQLKKMYENDDMTEETEEIILKRAQDSVDREKWDVEQVKVSTMRTLNVTIPREHDSHKRSLKLSQLEWDVAEEKAKREVATKKLEIKEQERNLKKSTRKLKELKSDLNELVVEAPHDGIVYYGAIRKGKWITAAAVEKKLIPGGRAAAREVLLTLVDPEQLQVRVAVAEDKLKDLKEEQKAKLSLKWNDEVEMDSEVESISYVPDANSTFDTVFSLSKDEAKVPVYPGMSAKLTIDTYRKENALTVPVKAVKKDGNKSYVIMKGGEKRWIKTGRADKEKQEVISGLKAGEEIEADLSSKTDDKK